MNVSVESSESEEEEEEEEEEGSDVGEATASENDDRSIWRSDTSDDESDDDDDDDDDDESLDDEIAAAVRVGHVKSVRIDDEYETTNNDYLDRDESALPSSPPPPPPPPPLRISVVKSETLNETIEQQSDDHFVHVTNERQRDESFVNAASEPEPSPPSPAKPKFSPRTESEDEAIVRKMMDSIDEEDRLMLKAAFQKLRDEDDPLVENLHWSYHPGNQENTVYLYAIMGFFYVPAHPPESPPSSSSLSVNNLHYHGRSSPERERVHSTGAARCEGYYKIKMPEKAKYVRVGPFGKDPLKISHTPEQVRIHREQTQSPSSFSSHIG